MFLMFFYLLLGVFLVFLVFFALWSFLVPHPCPLKKTGSETLRAASSAGAWLSLKTPCSLSKIAPADWGQTKQSGGAPVPLSVFFFGRMEWRIVFFLFSLGWMLVWLQMLALDVLGGSLNLGILLMFGFLLVWFDWCCCMIRLFCVLIDLSFYFVLCFVCSNSGC